MRLYAKHLFPHLLDWAMRHPRLDPYRDRTIAAARGRVLEIGVGSGLNLARYCPAVDRVYALDPSPALLRLACRRAAQAPVAVSLLQAAAEQLPFAAAVFDTVVMTWVLCSIAAPAAALAEIRRVLKPGGELLFVEHGLSCEPRIARWQRRITPAWRRLGGGCHLDRDVEALIRTAGFRLSALESGYMKGPKPWTFLYQGRAGAG